jgi:hypothetical protein
MTTMAQQRPQPRSPYRMPDRVWNETLRRIRGEFDEMPCMRLTLEQAGALFGLREPASAWVLGRLAEEGFLMRTPQGEFARAGNSP